MIAEGAPLMRRA